MSTPSTVFSEMVSTTLRNHSKKVDDNVSKHNALYRKMRSKGNVTKSGGYEIVMPLEYAENSTYQRYSGLGTLNIQGSDVITSAKYDWVQASVAVVASGREIRQNRGESEMISLVRSRVKNARNTAANNMSLDMYSSGTLANQMGGLGHLIQDDGQGTVGGIDSATWEFWRNKFREATGNASTTTIRGDMNALWLTLVRGTDKPDCIVSTHDLYSLYWESLDAVQRYTSSGAQGAEAGSNFESLKFKSADVFFDDNDNFATTAEKMYFINTDYLYMVEHEKGKWGQESKRVSVNQDAEVTLMLWMGQMCTSNRSLQGVMIDATDS